jgi:hypothetical protein
MQSLLAAAAALLILAFVLLLQQRAHFLQYLYFCRVPLVMGALMFALPILAYRGTPPLLTNFYVLDPASLGFVMIFATLAAWNLMFALALLLRSQATRTKVPFARAEPTQYLAGETVPGLLLAPRRLWNRASMALHRIVLRVVGFVEGRNEALLPIRAFLFFVLLALPQGIVAMALAWDEPASGGAWAERGEMAFAILLGAFFAGTLRRYALRAVTRLRRSLRQTRLHEAGWMRGPTWLWQFLQRLLDAIMARLRIQDLQNMRLTDDAQEELANLRRAGSGRAVAFFVLVLVTYIVGFVLFHPVRGIPVPALPLVYILIILTCLGFSGLSWFFDKLRVPIIAVVLVAMVVGYTLSRMDHYFETSVKTVDVRLPTIEEAFAAWHDSLPPAVERIPIFVAASGGGITAAYWTAAVLESLATDVELKDRFVDAVLLISSVSGGGVGAMYFVEAASTGRQGHLAEIADRAGMPSLSAAAWGFAYPDLGRLMIPFALARSRIDRGWAIEQPWRQQMLSPDATLRSWARGVRTAARPAQIFNATVTETGERFLLAPLALERHPPGVRRAYRSFFGDYGDAADLEVATAARLSATFPFVSPIARPRGPGVPDSLAWHLADGGYYDNYGVMTALEQMERVLRAAEAVPGRPLRRLILLQIRLKPEAVDESGSVAGWRFSALGPALTLLKVRNATQIVRNEFELRLMQEFWRTRGVEIVSLVLELPGKWPLSWQLAKHEKERIDRVLEEPEFAGARGRLVGMLNWGGG